MGPVLYLPFVSIALMHFRTNLKPISFSSTVGEKKQKAENIIPHQPPEKQVRTCLFCSPWINDAAAFTVGSQHLPPPAHAGKEGSRSHQLTVSYGRCKKEQPWYQMRLRPWIRSVQTTRGPRASSCLLQVWLGPNLWDVKKNCCQSKQRKACCAENPTYSKS